jgi:hypothetical protein
MNYRDTSNETSALWSVDAIEDMAFLQAANKEAFAHGVLAQLGSRYNQANMYVLWGCVNTGTYPAYDISEGAVYYRSAAAIAANLPGEIYTVDHSVFTVTSPHVAVAKVTATSDGDMRLFSDGSTKAVTMINKVVLSEGASGSGDVDFSNFVPLKKDSYYYQLNTGGATITIDSLFNSGAALSSLFTYTTPNDGITRNYKILFKASVSCTVNSGCEIQLLSGSTVLDQCKVVNPNTSFTFEGGMICLVPNVSIAPNTVITVQATRLTNNTDCRFPSLVIEEN